MRRIVFALLVAAPLLLAEDPPKPPAVKPIDAGHLYRVMLLQKEEQIIRLEVCSEAGVPHDKCLVNWQAGTVSQAPEPEKPKAEETPAK